MNTLVSPPILKSYIDTIGVDGTCEEIDKEMEKRVSEAQEEARKSGYSEGYNYAARYQKFWKNFETGFTILGWTVAVVAALAVVYQPFRIDRRAHEAEMRACQTGDSVGCLAAVQDQTGRSEDRVNLLKAAFSLRTGRPLPLLEGQTPDKVYNGLNVQQTSTGLQITNGASKVTVDNNNGVTHVDVNSVSR